MIFGTCGHRIDGTTGDYGFGFPIAVQDMDREGNKAISHRVVCADCLKWYQKENLIIKEENDEH
jgi:hypothetical protein